MSKKPTSPLRITEFVRLGKRHKNKLGVWVPWGCKNCGGVYKLVTETRRGKRVIKRRVTCYQCGKRQHGQRAGVQK